MDRQTKYLVDVVAGLLTVGALAVLHIPLPVAFVVGGVVAVLSDVALTKAPEKLDPIAARKAVLMAGIELGFAKALLTYNDLKRNREAVTLKILGRAFENIAYDMKTKNLELDMLERIDHFLTAFQATLERLKEFQDGQTRLASPKEENEYEIRLLEAVTSYAMGFNEIAIAIDLPDVQDALRRIKIIADQMEAEGLRRPK